MITFAHIGLPKTLSSAFQRSFFPDHPKIYYLGIGVGGPIDFIDDDINLGFDDLLVYAKDGYFQHRKGEVAAAIQRHRKLAEESGKAAFGISSEWFSFTLSADMIDNAEKPKRLAELLGNDSKIILVLRNQSSLLRSLYGQYIREGLALSYEEFLQYAHDFQDRNFYFDLHYQVQWRNLTKVFGKDNVYFLPIEDYRDPDGRLLESLDGRLRLLDRVCEILEIEYPVGFELPTVNPSLSRKELFHKRLLNRDHRHDFGNLLFEHGNYHRCRKFFEKEGAFNVGDFFAGSRRKHQSLDKAKELALEDPREIDYRVNSGVDRKLKTNLESANRKFVSVSGLELPNEYFELRF